MCKSQFAQSIDKAIMPGIQGGPLMHHIAAKAVAFKIALLHQNLKHIKNRFLSMHILWQKHLKN